MFLFLLLKANRLSTLSLQYDKRIEEELRGGKRKIKLIQEQVHFLLFHSGTITFMTFQSFIPV